MSDILENLKLTNQADLKQKGKTKYPLNKNNRYSVFCHDNRRKQLVDIATFIDVHHKQLQQIFPQHQTTPSHDTITRAFTMLTPHTYKPSKH
ncbi:MAG: transposase family protein, partial [Candidatus Bathyarchaeota archaeon]|uniref:hypothetical protein n=1 Tax=Candidatus Bathycorpusculum sp. TaxID=2994959 RepID=UPI00281E87CA|nr:transposase family protein [Candidatus Termiticorpusculum sp.]